MGEGEKAGYRSGEDAAGRISPPRVEVRPESAADPASGAEVARGVLRQGRPGPDDHRRNLAEILRRRREAQQEAGTERRTSAGEELRARGGVHVDLEALTREADERGLSAALGGSDDGLELGEEQTRDDPVHAATGEFWHRGVDLELPGVGLAFRLERTYRSRTHYSGPLGPGWTHTYDQRLFFEPSPCGAGAVHWWTGTGDIVRFERSFPSGYSSAPASPHELTESNDGRFLIRAPGRRQMEFERPYDDAPFAVLRRVEDGNGNALTLDWGAMRENEPILLRSVTDTLGRTIEFLYEAPLGHRLSGLRVPTVGLEVRYAYDPDARAALASATNAAGVSESYRYLPVETATEEEPRFIPDAHLAEACTDQCFIVACPAEDLCGAALAEGKRACQAACADTTRCIADAQAGCRAGCDADPGVGACRATCQEEVTRGCAGEAARACRRSGRFEDRIEEQCDVQCATACSEICSDHIDCEHHGPFAQGGTSDSGDWAASASISRDDACTGLSACRTAGAIDEVDETGPDTDGMCTGPLDLGWCCRTGCFDCCLKGDNCPYRSAMADGPDCDDHCEDVYFANCETNARAQCEKIQDCGAHCFDPCLSACESSARASCEDPSACLDTCEHAFSEAEARGCQNTCFEQCTTGLHHPTLAVAYGQRRDLEANLTELRDGLGVTFLRNEYGVDIGRADFDRVIRQEFGEATTTYHHYDLKAQAAVSGEDASLIDAEPGALDVCNSTCVSETVTESSPGARASERWVEVRDGEYLVLRASDPPERSLVAWPVESAPALETSAFFVISLEEEAPAGRVSPALPSIEPISLETPEGPVTITRDVRNAGRVHVEGGPARHFSGARALTLVRSRGRWLAYPTETLGAVAADCPSCGPEVSFEPEGASDRAAAAIGDGELEVRELARASDTGWRGVVSEPGAVTSWRFEGGRGERMGRRVMTPETRPQREEAPPEARPGRSGGPDLPGYPERPEREPGPRPENPLGEPTPARPEVADLERCLAGPPELDGTVPDCLGPWYEPEAPLGEPPVILTYTCDRMEFGPSLALPGGSRLIERAVVARDARGQARTFYSGRRGEVLRWIDHATSAREDRNYDDRGRLLGTQSAFGDRTCLLYGREHWSPTRIVRLPAPGVATAQTRIDQVLSWTADEQLDQVFAPDAPERVLLDHDYDARGNLTRMAWPGLSVERNFERDDRGRVVVETTTGEISTTFIYGPEGAGQVTHATVADPEGPVFDVELERDVLGRVTKRDALGAPLITSTWLADGRIASSTTDLRAGSGPVTTHYVYDGAGRLTEIRTPEQVQTITPNRQGRLALLRTASALDASNPRTLCLLHDGRGDLTEVVDPEGRRTRFERNAQGLVERIVRGVWSSGEAWDSACAENAGRTPPLRQVVAETTRDRSGRVLRHQPGEGSPSSTQYHYDGFGRVDEILEQGGVARVFGHDAAGRVVWVARLRAEGASPAVGALRIPGAAETRWSPERWDLSNPDLLGLTLDRYDDLGRLVEHRELHFEDEPSGRRIFLGRQQGFELTTYAHDDASRTLSVIEPSDRETRTTFDGLGRPRVTHVAGDLYTIERSYTRFDRGLRVAETVSPAHTPAGVATRTLEYATDGQLTSTIGADDTVLEARQYDAFGRLSRLWLPHLARTLRYDGFGALFEEYREREDGAPELFFRWNKNRVDEPVTVEDASGVLATYGYDGLGRVTSEALSRGTRTTWDYYPGTDLVRATTRPDGVTESLEYDAFGGVRDLRVSGEARTEANLHFERDPTGLRLATRTGAVGARASGRRSASTPTHVNRLTWSSTGELVREEVEVDGTTFLTTRRKEITDGGALETLAIGGRTFARRRDALGRLTELALDARPIVTYAYAGAGEVDQVRYGNGLVESHRTDALGWLTGVDTRAGARAVLGFDAHLDARGLLARLDTHDEACGTRASLYRSDAFGRLTESAMGIEGLAPWTRAEVVAEQLERHGAVRRRYDASDRLTRLEIPGDVDIRPVAAADHTPLDFGGPVASDDVGRVTGFEDGTQYRYGVLGELIEATLPSGESFSFSYDALGRLAAATGPDGRTHALRYLGAELVSIAGGEEHLVLHGRNLSPVVLATANETLWQHVGFGDRVTHVTDADGQIRETFEYSAFGEPRARSQSCALEPVSGGSGPRLLLTGRPYFPGLGLHGLGHRFYDPRWGQFLSPDPLRFIDGPNRYAYAGWSPHLYGDPDGLAMRRLEAFGSDAFFSTSDFLLGVQDGLLPRPTVGPLSGRARAHAVGQIIGSTLGFAVDGGMMLGGASLATTGSLECGTGVLCVAGAPQIAIGAQLAAAGIAGVAHHNGKRVEGYEALERTPEQGTFLAEGAGGKSSSGGAQGGGAAEGAALQPYGGAGGGHHVPAKSAFAGAAGYDVNAALAIPNAELARLDIKHPVVTASQMRGYRAFAQSSEVLSWEAVARIETDALVAGGMNRGMASTTVSRAIEALKQAGVSGPTRIPWGGR